jgi:hypothetical protein
MRYLIAIILPPVAILLCGKPVQFILNLILWMFCVILCFFVFGFFIIWVPILHALLVVHSHLADKRTDRIIKTIQQKG